MTTETYDDYWILMKNKKHLIARIIKSNSREELLEYLSRSYKDYKIIRVDLMNRWK